jgi:hypothetical protein
MRELTQRRSASFPDPRGLGRRRSGNVTHHPVESASTAPGTALMRWEIGPRSRRAHTPGRAKSGPRHPAVALMPAPCRHPVIRTEQIRPTPESAARHGVRFSRRDAVPAVVLLVENVAAVGTAVSAGTRHWNENAVRRRARPREIYVLESPFPSARNQATSHLSRRRLGQ